MQIHSPIERITHKVPDGVELYIKRDDMIHPFISGNKWRKLKYILQKAELQNRRHLITFGGAYSNHLLATACAGAKFGFRTTGIVRGEEQLPLNPTLFLCTQFGMQLIYADRQSYQDKYSLFELYSKDDPQAFFIDEGGCSPEAIQGCAELFDELKENYTDMVVACGTASTFTGLIQGAQNQQHHTGHKTTLIHGIVVHKGAGSLAAFTNSYITDTSAYRMHTGYHQGGYAKTNPELIAFISDFNRNTGILLDPVYTGKMMYAVYDMISKKELGEKAKILCIHTGGLTGILGMTDKF